MDIRQRLQEMKDMREKIKEQKKKEWEQKVKEYYHPEPEDEQELRKRELAKHVDYLRRLRERHEKGEL